MAQRKIDAKKSPLAATFQEVFTFRWQPSLDLLAVAVSWVLVVAGLSCATFVVGTKPLGGMGYFLTYAVLTALIFGFCLPIAWMLFVRKTSPLAVGITSRKILPSVLIQVVLAVAQFALYHIGYGMPWSEIGLLFFIGLLFAVVFRITANVLILWPLFQPLGQLATLIRDGLQLPLAASLGFIDVLAAMIAVVVIAYRIHSKRSRT